MLDIKNLLLALAAGLLVGSFGSWLITASYKDAVWTKAAKVQELKATQMLQTETAKVLAGERERTRLNNLLEKNDVDARAKIEVTLADNRRLVAQLGGLRDPGRRSSCHDSQAAVDPARGTAGDPTGAELSAEASGFLLEFAAEADRAAQYAQTCHAWAQQVIQD